MSQLFHPISNAYARGSIVFGGILAGSLLFVGWANERSPYTTNQNVVREQPVPFSHNHHVSGLGIDCRYCHLSVEKGGFAGIPPTQVCYGCHAVIWKDSPMLEPVRSSYQTGKPLQWNRVTDMPDFVYFNHSIHIAKGIGCESCHGDVSQMPLVRKAKTLQMEFCLECHRHPEINVREKEDVFKFAKDVTKIDQSRGEQLVRDRGIVTKQLDNCGICHR
jgi:hypothetical protein